MGADQAVKEEGNEAGEGVEATVIELLPNAAYRVELENRTRAIAHLTGVNRANFVRVRLKDKVLVELSPHDRTRGRIVKLLGKG
jgi:translation initiation factor IF-1